MKTLNDLYAIMVDYHFGDMDGNEWTKPQFLGLDGLFEILVFEDTPSIRTRVFTSKATATKYVKDHDLKNGLCCRNGRVVKLNGEEA